MDDPPLRTHDTDVHVRADVPKAMPSPTTGEIPKGVNLKGLAEKDMPSPRKITLMAETGPPRTANLNDFSPRRVMIGPPAKSYGEKGKGKSGDRRQFSWRGNHDKGRNRGKGKFGNLGKDRGKSNHTTMIHPGSRQPPNSVLKR